MQNNPANSSSHTATVITNDKVKIAYQVLGKTSKQPPLVMIIGLSGVKEDWRSLSHDLAKNRQVIVMDNRGLGESDIPPGPYSTQMMATDVLAVINQLGYQKVDVMGHSLGGMIAQQFTALFPSNVRKLILASTCHGGPNQAPLKAESAQSFQVDPNASAFEKAAKVLRINFTPEWIDLHPDIFERVVNASLQYHRSGRGIVNQMSAAMAFDNEEQIKRFDLPVLVIHGTEDQLLDFKNGEMIAAKIPNASFVAIKKGGHMTWIMDEGLTEQAIENFLIHA